MTSLPLLFGLAASTLASEDLASVGAGLLARDGHLPLGTAVLACAAGVYVGDLGLWSLGRVFGRRFVVCPWISRRLPRGLPALAARVDAHVGWSVVLSRVLPGSRLPVYVAAGIWGRRPWAFAAWSLLAVTLWTPALVVAAAYLGTRVETLFDGVQAAVATACVAAGLLAALRLLGRLASPGLHLLGDRRPPRAVVTAEECPASNWRSA